MRTLRGINHPAPALPSTRVRFDAAPPQRRSAPAGAVSVGAAPAAAVSPAPLALRLKVLATRGRLDRQIAAGGACEANDALALRTRQLTDPRSQRQIADSLRRIIDYVDRREPRALISSVVIEPQAVRGGRDAILRLAERLEECGPVSPRGIVLARRFLSDGLSPLFNPSCKRTVTQAAQEIQDALEELPPTGFDALAA